MEGRFPFGKLPKYPHMKPEDVAVWERFIAQNPRYFVTCDYDVPVGTGAPTNPEHPENIQADHKILTQKKIDVVGYSTTGNYVVEVKPVADMKALGQILVYRKLYLADNPNLPLVHCMVVCGSVERELGELFAEHDIMVEVA